MQTTPENLNSENIQELISDDENGCCLFLGEVLKAESHIPKNEKLLFLGEDFKVRCRKQKSFIPDEVL